MLESWKKIIRNLAKINKTFIYHDMQHFPYTNRIVNKEPNRGEILK